MQLINDYLQSGRPVLGLRTSNHGFKIYLRNLKSEEVIRFAESPPDLEEGEHDDILRLNEQIKKNEGLRRGQVQEISG